VSLLEATVGPSNGQESHLQAHIVAQARAQLQLLTSLSWTKEMREKVAEQNRKRARHE